MSEEVKSSMGSRAEEAAATTASSSGYGGSHQYTRNVQFIPETPSRVSSSSGGSLKWSRYCRKNRVSETSEDEGMSEPEEPMNLTLKIQIGAAKLMQEFIRGQRARGMEPSTSSSSSSSSQIAEPESDNDGSDVIAERQDRIEGEVSSMASLLEAIDLEDGALNDEEPPMLMSPPQEELEESIISDQEDSQSEQSSSQSVESEDVDKDEVFEGAAAAALPSPQKPEQEAQLSESEQGSSQSHESDSDVDEVNEGAAAQPSSQPQQQPEQQLPISEPQQSSSQTRRRSRRKSPTSSNSKPVERYVGSDVFGNYRMLKPEAVKKMLQEENPDGPPVDEETLRKYTTRINHYLEDFFVQHCEQTRHPHGFIPLGQLLPGLIEQGLLPNGTSTEDFIKEFKGSVPQEDFKRSEGILIPSRYSTTGDTDDYYLK